MPCSGAGILAANEAERNSTFPFGFPSTVSFGQRHVQNVKTL